MNNVKCRMLLWFCLVIAAIASTAVGYNREKKASAQYHDQCECYPVESYHFDIDPAENKDIHFDPSAWDEQEKFSGTVGSDKISAESSLPISGFLANCFLKGTVVHLSGYFKADKGKCVTVFVKFNGTSGEVKSLIGNGFTWQGFDYVIDLTNTESITSMSLVVTPPEGSTVNVDEIRICRQCWDDTREDLLAVKNITVKTNNNGTIEELASYNGTVRNNYLRIPKTADNIIIDVEHKSEYTISFNNVPVVASSNHSVSNQLTVDYSNPRNVSIDVDGSDVCSRGGYSLTVERDIAADGLLENVTFSPFAEIVGGFNRFGKNNEGEEMVSWDVILKEVSPTFTITPQCGNGVSSIMINGVVSQKNGESAPIPMDVSGSTEVVIQVITIDGVKWDYVFNVTDIAIYWDPDNVKNLLESNAATDIKLKLTRSLDQAVSVDLTYVMLGNTSSSDVTFGATTITFPAGTITQTVSGVTILADNDPEADELFSVTAHKPEGGVVPVKMPVEAIFTIKDDDGFTLGFENGSYSDVNETDDIIYIPVCINTWPVEGVAADASVTIGPGTTAIEGVDFQFQAVTPVYWNGGGEHGLCDAVAPVKLLYREGDNGHRIISLILNGGNKTTVIEEQKECLIGINDVDRYKVSFNSEYSSANEPPIGSPQEYVIDVRLNEDCIENSTDRVTAKYEIESELEEGIDYTIAIDPPGLVWIDDDCATSVVRRIRLTLIGDGIPNEETEIIQFVLTDITGATVGTNPTYTFYVWGKRTVSFETPEMEGYESTLNPGINVRIDKPLEAGQTVSLNYAFNGVSSTAVKGEHFNLPADCDDGTCDPLIFTPDISVVRLPVTIIDNLDKDATAPVIQFDLTSITGENVAIGEISTCRYTIKDDDGIRYVRSNIVEPSQGEPPLDGKSWGTAYKYLYDALNEADQVPGSVSEIWVAKGFYTPVNKTIRMKIADNLKIYGGFPDNGGTFGSRNWRKYETIISGDIANNDAPLRYNWGMDVINSPLMNDNAEVLLRSGSSALLDGFYIEGAFSTNVEELNHIGAINCLEYSQQIFNCHFRYNFTTAGASAIMIVVAPGTIVSNCIFEKNLGGHGGAIQVNGTGATLINSLFTQNRAMLGGAVYLNTTQDFSPSQIYNCTFLNNSAAYIGGGIFGYDSKADFLSCIFYGNNSPESQDIGISEGGYPIVVAYSRTQSVWNGEGNGNTTADAYLTADGHLTASSVACINKGNPSTTLTDFPCLGSTGNPVDLGNNLRFRNDHPYVDMGAYEYYSDGTISNIVSSVGVMYPAMFDPFRKEYVLYVPSGITRGDITVLSEDGAISIVINGDQNAVCNTPYNVSFENVSVVNVDVYKLGRKVDTYSIRIKDGGVVVYVKTTGSDENDGLSWENAKLTVESAIAEAKIIGPSENNPVNIHVGSGTYRPQPAAGLVTSLVLVPYISLYGGFPAEGGNWESRSTDNDVEINPTILDANYIPGNQDIENNLYNIIIAASNCSVDGFILKNGYGRISTWSGNCPGVSCGSGVPMYGGAILIRDADEFSLANCIVANNRCLYDGGALYCTNSSVRVTHCYFNQNNAEINGGAIYAQHSYVTVEKSKFTGNNALSGGAITSLWDRLVLTGTYFNGNRARSDGGAIYQNGTSLLIGGGSKFVDNSANSSNENVANGGAVFSDAIDIIVENTKFATNIIIGAGLGGALFIGNTCTNLEVVNSQFVQNQAGTIYDEYGFGGGLYSCASNANFKNDVFFGNSAGVGAGVVFEQVTGEQLFTNCILAKNTALYDAGIYGRWVDVTASVKIYNSTIVGNGGNVETSNALFLNYDGDALTQPEIINTIVWYAPEGALFSQLSGNGCELQLEGNNNYIQVPLTSPDLNNPQFNVSNMGQIVTISDLLGGDDVISANDALMLTPNSPCKNAGKDNCTICNKPFLDYFKINGSTPEDITGNIRANGLIDVGAYEIQ